MLLARPGMLCVYRPGQAVSICHRLQVSPGESSIQCTLSIFVSGNDLGLHALESVPAHVALGWQHVSRGDDDFHLQRHWCCTWTTALSLFLSWITCAGAESILRCLDEFGPMNSHDEAIQALDGKRIYFVGDSITRYQYLELAYFAAHKRCPDPTQPHYILSEAWFEGWNDFYANVSTQLEVNTETHRTSELSMATRITLRPLDVCEHRTFHYEDAKVRHTAPPRVTTDIPACFAPTQRLTLPFRNPDRTRAASDLGGHAPPHLAHQPRGGALPQARKRPPHHATP